jgi:hypothetical protein
MDLVETRSHDEETIDRVLPGLVDRSEKLTQEASR